MGRLKIKQEGALKRQFRIVVNTELALLCFANFGFSS